MFLHMEVSPDVAYLFYSYPLQCYQSVVRPDNKNKSVKILQFSVGFN